jgi:hypothetical protein
VIGVRIDSTMKGRSSSAAFVAAFVLMVFSATASATYTIENYAFTEGGGTSSDGRYEISFTTGQGAPVGVASTSNFGLASGIVYTISGASDVTGPLLSHAPTVLVKEHTPVEIDVNVSDAKTGVDTVTLFYHEGGLVGFRARQMQLVEGDTYRGTIPASSVDERGLAYYIRARDGAGNISRYPPTAPDSVVSLGVWFDDLGAAFALPVGSYRMISVPGSTSGDPDSILVDDLGAYDKKSWRLGRWNASGGDCGEYCYDEYPAIDDFRPGRGFWLISARRTRFDASGSSTDITRPFAIELEKGWNQIGTPFTFTTDWPSADILFDGSVYTVGDEHIVGSDTIFVEDNLISYDGSYHGFESELEPWEGYWIHNSSTQDVRLRFHPEVATALLASSPYDTDQMAVLIGVAVGWDQSKKRMSFAGTSHQARDGWDELDHREPPVIGDYVRAVFRRDSWGRHAGTYMCDIKAANDDGAMWDLKVESSKPTAVTLDVEPLIDLPDNWTIAVYDIDAGIRLTSSSLPHHFMVEENREVVLVAGTDRFIETQETRSGFGLKAQIVSISPNPFSQTARISFFIPRPADVRLQVYSVEGRLVSTLADSEFEAGLHSADWHGSSRNGSHAAPGIYFLRLETSGTVLTEKILRLQ